MEYLDETGKPPTWLAGFGELKGRYDVRGRHREQSPSGVTPLGFTPQVIPANIPRDRKLEAQIRDLQAHTEQLRELRKDITKFSRLITEEPDDSSA